MNAHMERPTSLTVIAWYWIITSALSLIFAGIPMLAAISMFPGAGFFPAEHMAFSVNTFSRGMESGMPYAPEQLIQPAIQAILFMTNYFVWYFVLAFIMAVGGIAGGIGLLQLRAWGRQVIEIFSWIRIFEYVIAAIVTAVFWIGIAMMAGQPGMPREMGMMGGLGYVVLAMLLTFWLFWIAIYALMIYYLRDEDNRALVEEYDAGYWEEDETGGG